MKRLLISMILAGCVSLLVGCASDCGGGCGGGCGYVRMSSCNNICTTCSYGSGYNDWY